MKKISFWSLCMLSALVCCMFAACSDFKPTEMPEALSLPKVSNLKAEVSGFNVELSWTLPNSTELTGVRILPNGKTVGAIDLQGPATSFTVEGQPLGEEFFYTVKAVYNNGISEGESVAAILQKVELANVSNLKSTVNGRTVTLTWNLPSAQDITGIRVVRNGDEDAATVIEGAVTSCVLKAQPMEQELTYTVKVVYNKYYAAEGMSTSLTVPYIAPKMGFLMTAASIAELPDDDERAAATWFTAQENAELIQPSQIADLDIDLYPVMWIMIDRVDLPLGWQNLPSEISNEQTIAALRNYSANGGSLYLSNMATQLAVPLGFVPDNMAPTVYGNGQGGSGDDVWVLNAYLGWDFRNGSDQGFYDRTAHAIYKGLTFEDPNNYGYNNLPLIGPGQREDHNCLWDCNIYGRGSYPDVIKNFEVTTNSMVLATWGHVRDHCVAAIVDFYANPNHGRCVANGLAAYEWNQNSGTNPYQHNIEQLTPNILDYLK